MEEILIRTEDIPLADILNMFVETENDRQIVNCLKGKMPYILVGSRGVGKSFLLKVAQAELKSEFESKRSLPVYISFISSPLLQGLSDKSFNAWMLSKILTTIIRELNKIGVTSFPNLRFNGINRKNSKTTDLSTHLEQLVESLESAWQDPTAQTTNEDLDTPDAEQIKDAIEEVCIKSDIQRIILLIDEASHIFIPNQQRLFFSLFRDLRNPYLNCKAAVYPGVTSYGPNFQPTHDASMLTTERDIRGGNYIQSMKDIALKQVSPALSKQIEQYGRNFSILAYSAHGNPRTLLKSLAKGVKLSSSEINLHIKDYYRTEVWSEHSLLSQKYSGHRALIDWARNFIENSVLPALTKKNNDNLEGSTAYFWIHRDAPAYVHQAMGILKYTGIVQEHMAGVKNGFGEIGTKYIVNLGCLFSLLGDPVIEGSEIAAKLDDKRYVLFGKNHIAFSQQSNEFSLLNENSLNSSILGQQLQKDIQILDLTDFQKKTLISVGIKTIADILKATDAKIQEAKGIGIAKTRKIRNAAYTAVFEYLSG